MTPPRPVSALPPYVSLKASPKAISGRTSYLRVRLEFLRYPHLISTFFNRCEFGPPPPFTAASTWTWVGHPVSGLCLLTVGALLRLGFPPAPDFVPLTLPVTITRRTVLQKVRSSTHTVVPQLVNTGFQVLFHSPPGVLFTFPSQYYPLSVTEEYLALRGGPRSFPQGSTCLVVLWILLSVLGFRVRGFHSLRPAFPKPFRYPYTMTFAVRTPERTRSGLGSFPFARRYLGNHCCFLFLRLLRCFSSPGSPPCVMDWRMDDWSFSSRVSPFRHRRVSGYLLLTAAFRSLSRLSSALSAKASALRSSSLDLLFRCISVCTGTVRFEMFL